MTSPHQNLDMVSFLSKTGDGSHLQKMSCRRSVHVMFSTRFLRFLQTRCAADATRSTRGGRNRTCRPTVAVPAAIPPQTAAPLPTSSSVSADLASRTTCATLVNIFVSDISFLCFTFCASETTVNMESQKFGQMCWLVHMDSMIPVTQAIFQWLLSL